MKSNSFHFPEEDFEPIIGSSVLVFGRYIGTVRWIGILPERTKNHYGIELVDSVGSCDGSKKNVEYFKCEPMHGIFCKRKYLYQNTPLIKAVIWLQTIWKKKQAYRLILQNIWNMLDNYAENCEQQVEDQLDKLEELVKYHQENGNKPELYVSKSDPTRMVIPSNYTGYHLRFPILEDNPVIDLMKYYRDGHTLHYSYAFKLVDEMKKLLSAAPLVSDIKIVDTLTVCGDTHGQFADLCMIFDKRGYPSPTNKFLFNGDFVDRGQNGIEVLLTLYAWKLLYPNSVYLNKGNHESKKLNEKYKFAEECIKKYDPIFFEHIQQSFDHLPLCSVIENEIFVVHGGLFKKSQITLERLRQITYRGQPKSRSSDPDLQLIEDMLWSDPKQDITGIQPSSRGAGCWFGEDITNEFLQLNNLRMIIRSHELVQEGYELLHDGKVVTIFSASHYDNGKNNNKGAYIILNPTYPLIPIYEQYEANDSEFYFKQLEDSTIRKLKKMIFIHRHHLSLLLSKKDKSDNGFVSKNTWAKIMNKVFEPKGIKLPWNILQPKLAEINQNGQIHIVNFLEKYRSKPLENSEYEQLLFKKIASVLWKNSENIENSFKLMDINKDDKISYEEFYNHIKSLNLEIDDDLLYDLMRLIDKNRDNTINLQEFLSQFQISFKLNKIQSDNVNDKFLYNALNNIGKKILMCSDPIEMFSKVDRNGDNLISSAEFKEFLQINNFNYNIDEFNQIIDCIDENKDGIIDINEFIKAFTIICNRKFCFTSIDKISQKIMANKLYFRKMFHLYDINRTGIIDKHEFKAGIRCVNKLLNPDEQLSDDEIEFIDSIIELNDRVNYEEFLASFTTLE